MGEGLGEPLGRWGKFVCDLYEEKGFHSKNDAPWGHQFHPCRGKMYGLVWLKSGWFVCFCLRFFADQKTEQLVQKIAQKNLGQQSQPRRLELQRIRSYELSHKFSLDFLRHRKDVEPINSIFVRSALFVVFSLLLQ